VHWGDINSKPNHQYSNSTNEEVKSNNNGVNRSLFPFHFRFPIIHPKSPAQWKFLWCAHPPEHFRWEDEPVERRIKLEFDASRVYLGRWAFSGLHYSSSEFPWYEAVFRPYPQTAYRRKGARLSSFSNFSSSWSSHDKLSLLNFPGFICTVELLCQISLVGTNNQSLKINAIKYRPSQFALANDT